MFFLRNHVFSIVIQLLGYWLSGWEPVPIYVDSWISTAALQALYVLFTLLMKYYYCKNLFTEKLYGLTPGKQHVVSRKDGNLLLPDDQSISRKHAQLFVSDV